MPTESGEFILNTENITDFDTTSDTPNTMKAKLFVMDYHNIRGRTSSLLAYSNTLSWRSTTA